MTSIRYLLHKFFVGDTIICEFQLYNKTFSKYLLLWLRCISFLHFRATTFYKTYSK